MFVWSRLRRSDILRPIALGLAVKVGEAGGSSGYLFPGLRPGLRAPGPQCLATSDVPPAVGCRQGPWCLRTGSLGPLGLPPHTHVLMRAADAGFLLRSSSCSQLRLSPGTPTPPGSPPCAAAGRWGTQGVCPHLSGSPSLATRCLVSSGLPSSVVLFTCVRAGASPALDSIVWAAPRRGAQTAPARPSEVPLLHGAVLSRPQLASRANWVCPCETGHCRRLPGWATPAARPDPDRTQGQASARRGGVLGGKLNSLRPGRPGSPAGSHQVLSPRATCRSGRLPLSAGALVCPTTPWPSRVTSTGPPDSTSPGTGASPDCTGDFAPPE